MKASVNRPVEDIDRVVIRHRGKSLAYNMEKSPQAKQAARRKQGVSFAGFFHWQLLR